MDQRQLQKELSRKSVPYQVIKYILLLLNIMIVTTTAIVTIIICLLPTIIYEKKLSVESALSFLKTGNLIPEQDRKQGFRTSLSEQQEADLVQLSAQEVETIRVIRFIILGLSACIIMNQTLAVFGLFRERICYILLSSTFIGLVGQLTLFVLPAPIFLLIVLYLTFSISFVILLNHLDSLVKLPLLAGRSVSRASSLEPQACGSTKVCCCRCKNCLCNPMPFSVAPSQMTATINPNRKTSIPFSQTTPGNVPYYGSLGRKSRESRLYLSQLQAMKNVDAASDIYGQRAGSRLNSAAAQLKPGNKFTNLAMDNYKGPYGTVRRESSGYNYANLDRINNSTMI